MTTELAPTTQRSPIVTPLVTTQLTPNQQLAPIRTGPFEVKPCQVTGLLGIVVAVVGVADEAVVGEHHVVADLDPLLRGQHRVAVEEAALADLDLRLGAIVIQQPGSSSVPSPIRSRPASSASSTSPSTG